jgi:hypothetical protein
MQAVAKRRSHLVGCGWFWAWALVGAAGVLAFVSFIGFLLLIPVVVAVSLLTRRGPVRGAFGALTGAGAVLLFIAYLQRQGPGETCWHTATAGGCVTHLNPIPWLVFGLACFVAGFVGHARQND